MKKILTLICTLLCANVLLAQVGTELYDPNYRLYYSITSMNPPEVKIIDHVNNKEIFGIPSQITYNGQIYTVTAIGQGALRRKSQDGVIESPFIIPNSITSIEADAFSGQIFMTYITIPNSVTSIGGGVFYNCSRLTSVTLSNNITSLPAYGGYGFFEDCDSLTSITIPNSVTSIGNDAFRNCSSLTSVTCLAETAPTIGSNVFEYTPDTKTLMVACGVDYSSWEDSTTWANIQYTDLDIFRIGNLRYEKISNTEVKIIDCNDSVTEIIIPLSVEQCGISYNVTSIGSGAFANCSFLQNITCLATTPPTLEDNTVFPYPNIASLNVPCGSLEDYSAPTSYWNVFFAGRISENGYNVEVSVNDETFGSVAV
ncbi:MAG: leucine-rich repeat domain-containing protein, partial [Bacteroidales bacterium]|nr:leucine-rich repeat domain-containing protein [Bacteroidales bacterium]